MSAHEVTSGVALVCMSNPPLNVLGLATRSALLDAVIAAERDPHVEAIVICGAGAAFSAGADIAEFMRGEFSAEPWLPDIVERLEATSKPLVAAIHSSALGGGLEVALACHARYAHRNASFGFPEVRIGVIPGAGGTQRMPRVVDLRTALQMVALGRTLNALEACQLGLVDEVHEDDSEFIAAAVRFAAELAAQRKEPRRLGHQTVRPQSHSVAAFADARERADKEFAGEHAPRRAIDAVEAATNVPFCEGLRLERALLAECVADPQARALIHVFFAEREARKVPGIDATVATSPIETAAVIGGGTMGTGIAMCLADAGIPTRLIETLPAALDRALERIRANYQDAVRRGRMSPHEADARVARIGGSLRYDDVAQVDLVIEAVFENLQLKRSIFDQLDAVCKPGTLLATNTSTLDVNAIAAATRRPQDVVGLHFFSPANVMKLLEIVRADAASSRSVAQSLALASRLRKVPVVVGVCFGFVGNRMLEPYAREAHRLLLEGASVRQIERALVGCGLKMDPLSMYDLAGIDIGCQVRESRRQFIAHDPSYQIMGDRLAALGRYGMKSGRGFYRYEGRQKIDDPAVDELAERVAQELGVTRRSIGDEEVRERCLYMLINEGAETVREGVALRASDCDVIWCNGYGFPRYLGGPMHYADSIGLDRVLAGIRKYRGELGAYGRMWFTPSLLLEQLAAERSTFAAYDARRKVAGIGT